MLFAILGLQSGKGSKLTSIFKLSKTVNTIEQGEWKNCITNWSCKRWKDNHNTTASFHIQRNEKLVYKQIQIGFPIQTNTNLTYICLVKNELHSPQYIISNNWFSQGL